MAIAFNSNRDLNRIFRTTSGGTVFSSNLSGSTSFDYFSDTAVVNDALYFGITTPLFAYKDFLFYVGTAMSGTYTITFEYRATDGTWKALSSVTDNTNGFQTLGQNSVTFTVPTDWTVYTVNSVSAVWARARLSSVTSVTEGGAQSTQKVQAGNFALTVTGYSEATPATFTDIYNADVAGAWGVITNQGSQFRISCNLQIGEGTTVGYLVTKNEGIETNGGIYAISNYGYFTMGELVDLDSRTVKNGSSLTMLAGYARGYYRFLGGTTTFLYSSSFYINSYVLYFSRAFGCIFNNTTIACVEDATNSILDRLSIIRSSEIALDFANAVVNDVFCHDSTYAIRTVNANTAKTLRNFRGRSNTYLMVFSGGIAGTKPFSFVDADTNTWAIWWSSTPTPGYAIREQYSFNIEVIDKNNNPISGATVKLLDVNGSEQFSAVSDGSGLISEQIITAKKYTWASGTSPGVTTTTDYSPFTLSVSKTGYQIYKSKITLDKKVDWKICLHARNSVFDGLEG